MKHLYSTLFVVLAFSFCIQLTAQRHNNLSKIEQHLSLTAEQSTLLEALHLEQREAFEALSEDATRQDKKEIRDSYKAKLAEILTEEQLAKFESKRGQKGQRAKRDGLGNKGNGKYKFNGQKNRRALSDEQKTELRNARTALDTQLSEEDKSLIDELRLKSKALKESFKGNKESLRTEERQSLRDESKDIKESLKTLSRKYKHEIKKALSEIREKKSEKTEKPNRRSNKHEGKRGHHAAKRFGNFLLMDVDEMADSLVPSTMKPELKLSPNPAVNNTELIYTIHAEGPVVIDIRDEQGQVIKTLLNESKKIGTHTLSVDLDQLQNKSYFITIMDKFATQTEQLLIVK